MGWKGHTTSWQSRPSGKLATVGSASWSVMAKPNLSARSGEFQVLPNNRGLHEGFDAAFTCSNTIPNLVAVCSQRDRMRVI